MAAIGRRIASGRIVSGERKAGFLPRLLILLLIAGSCAHQPRLTISEYGLPVVDRLEVLERLVARDPEKALVDLEKFAPQIRLDIRYATANNFMRKPLYPASKAFLRCPAAQALLGAQGELEPQGLGLKVFDAYRPYRVTVEMWEPIRNPDYVADPAKGSRHNRGAAVDVTLVDLQTGEELPMPTEYDDFTPRAAHGFPDLPPHILRHRAVLREAMERHGFQALPSEWWHYDFRGWERFEILDLPPSELERSTPVACSVRTAKR